MPISLNPYTHPLSMWNFYHFSHESHLTTSWIYVGLQEVEKLFSQLKIVSENLGLAKPGDVTISVDYQVDTETDWHYIGRYTTSFSETLDLTDTNDLTGKRIRLRIRLQTTHTDKSPRLLATVLDTITRVQTKYQTVLNFRIGTNDQDLTGNPDGDYDEKIELLEEWASSARPIRLDSVIRGFTDLKVLIEPASIRVLSIKGGADGGEDISIGQMVVLVI